MCDRRAILGVAVIWCLSFWPAVVSAQCRELPCDVPVSGGLPEDGSVDCFSFTVSDSEVIELVVGVGDEEGGAQPRWRLVDAGGTAAGGCGTFTVASRLDCGPLTAAGNPYRVEVTDSSDEGGDYIVELQRLTAGQTCESNISQCEIEQRSDSDLIGFNVAAGDPVVINVVGGAEAGENFEPYWRVVDASGRPAGTCAAFALQPRLTCGPLPIAGNPYRVEVSDLFGDDEGQYEVSVDGHAFCEGGGEEVTISVGSAGGAAGGTVHAEVVLSTNDQTVAATQNCITFDAATPVLANGGSPACSVNPSIHKDGSSFAFRPSGCRPGVDCSQVCAVVLALDNVDPIPDGAVVYSCAFQIADGAAPGSYPLACSDAIASDPASNRLQVECRSGAIDVTAAVCVGDCDHDGHVTVDELVRGVNIALGNTALSECPVYDVNADGAVTVQELVAAVSRALNGC